MKRYSLLLTLVSLLFLGVESFAQQPDWKRINCKESSVFTGVVTINGEVASTDDIVGVFVNGECRMLSAVIHVNDSSFVSAVVHTDEVTTAKIKYWHAATNTIYELDTNFIIVPQGSIKRFPIEIKSDENVTSVPEVKADVIEVYPSPFTDLINVETNKQIKKILVVNSIGKTVATINDVNSSSTTIESSSFSVGIYLVSIEFSDGSVVTKKVVKK